MRVVDGALYGSVSYITNRASLNSTTDYASVNSVGYASDFSSGAADVQGLIFSASFTSPAVFTYNFQLSGTDAYGNTISGTATGSVTWDVTAITSNLQMRQAIAASMQSQLNSYCGRQYSNLA